MAARVLPLLLLVVVAAAMARAPTAHAWGKEGHYMVCKIAEVRDRSIEMDSTSCFALA